MLSSFEVSWGRGLKAVRRPYTERILAVSIDAG